MIYERTHTRAIEDYGGLASLLPVFSTCFFIVTLSSIAVPLTNGFVGEFLILLGLFREEPVFASIAVLGVILSATYMLWMFKKVFFGKESPTLVSLKNEGRLTDLDWREMACIFPLIGLVFIMGIFPNLFLNLSQASISYLSANRYSYELSVKNFNFKKETKTVNKPGQAEQEQKPNQTEEETKQPKQPKQQGPFPQEGPQEGEERPESGLDKIKSMKPQEENPQVEGVERE